MRVQLVLGRGVGSESWTVLDDEFAVIGAVDGFLEHLSVTNRSPNTVKAYAHDLRDLFDFLAGRGIDWRELTPDDLEAFIAWLRAPKVARAPGVAVLPSATGCCSPSTVNRKLAAAASFYEFHRRHGTPVGEWMLEWRRARSSTSSWQPLLAHLGAKPVRAKTVSLRAPAPVQELIGDDDAAAVIGACARLRDRLLFTVLRDTGMRIGEAVGLRHEDIDAAGCQVTVRFRVNTNFARSKSVGRSRTIPVGRALIRLYSDYLHVEYGDLDSDYVFVNLWAGPVGRPMRYSAVNSLVTRLQRSTGVSFIPHAFRHAYATGLLQRGVAPEVVQLLLGHASYATTVDTYGHLQVDDLRRALERAGVLERETVAR